jgi:hypothetical protein
MMLLFKVIRQLTIFRVATGTGSVIKIPVNSLTHGINQTLP